MKKEIPSRYRLEDCNRIIELVTEAQKLKRERQSETPIEKSANKWSVRLLGVAGASMVGLLALIPIVDVWHNRLIGDLATVLGIVTELGAIFSLLALITSQAAWFIRIRKHPATPLFDLVRADVSLYASSVGDLAIFGPVSFVTLEVTLYFSGKPSIIDDIFPPARSKKLG